MNRRTFFKNLFGVAIITALPAPVMDAIIELDEKEPIKINTDQLLYLYDQNGEVVAWSDNFYVHLNISYVDVSSMWSKYPKLGYTPRARSWHVSSENITLYKPGGELFNDNNYKMVLMDKTTPIKYIGNVFITDIYYNMEYLEPTKNSIKLTGDENLLLLFKEG